MLTVRQEVSCCLPVETVVLEAGVDTVDGDVEEPGEHVGDGVLPPVVLPAHPVNTLTGPALLVHRPDTQLPPGTAHWGGQCGLLLISIGGGVLLDFGVKIVFLGDILG